MNKSAIQKYAIWARTEMIAQVEQRAYQYGITKDGYGEENAVTVQGRALSNQEQEQRWELIQQIKHKGYTQVMEEVAYTWFNRFIALRFMEVNNYLPSHIRVFSDSTGAYKPEILSSAMQVELEGLDRNKVAQMIDANQTEDLYRYLLLTQCNALNEALPRMFEKMGGYTELLLPNNILRADGILGRMVNEIPEEDWTDQVQIIGWLYQYYNAELKDETFALLKKNVKITKERIPSATQLFTPDWIVRYMVENSLGRLWKEHIAANARDECDEVPGDKNELLLSKWKYYVHDAEQTPEVEKQLTEIRKSYKDMKPQDIKVIDPCMGSGHILVYAFDVLMQIYEIEGWSQRDAAKSILENNLYGLDIDDRAAQLAYFAVMMKARQYDRRIFSRGVQPNVFAIQESNNINRRHLKFFGWQMSDMERNLALNQLNTVLEEMNDAKEYGSILNISKQDWDLLYRFVLSVDYSGQMTLEAMGLEDTKEQLFELVKIAVVMTQKYDVVVTNPPYMNSGGMTSKLADYVAENYAEAKYDLFAVMMSKTTNLCKRAGYCALITMESWMFRPSFEKFRRNYISEHAMRNAVHMPYLGKGRNSMEISFGTIAYVTLNYAIEDCTAQFCYIRYFELDEQLEPATFPVINERFCQMKPMATLKIPGSSFGYWASNAICEWFTKEQLASVGLSKSGMQTGNNDRFLRFWHEVDVRRIGFDIYSFEECQKRNVKWIPQTKGGEFRKWYGNFDYIVNFEDSGREIREYPGTVRLRDPNQYFKKGITWSHTSSRGFGARLLPDGFTFNVESPVFSVLTGSEEAVLGLLNSKVTETVLRVLNQTMSYQSCDIERVPLSKGILNNSCIEDLVSKCIVLSRQDWDSFEVSWDFQCHPLINMIAKGGSFFDVGRISLAECYMMWESEGTEHFNQLKANEEELNRIFIDIYGLQDELTPEVEDKDVTVRKADLGRDIRSLISYAVGCMFGRYSLNVPGLAYAGGNWDDSKYSTIIPEKDNIIPICDDDYFDDDITARFIRWVETVYGKDTLEENLKFIANALGGKGQPREVIRNYFINDFYADHLKVYQKRPIYWLFDSGKKNGFKALIYMHRYQSDLLARMRTDYVHEMQERYRTQLTHLNDAIAQASTSERMKLNKQLKKIQDQALELQKYEEKIHHLADQNIKIDLDDGVKHNYALFGDVLAKIK